MKQTIPQEEVRRSIISDMVQKRNSIVPVIGEDAMVYSLGVPFVLLWCPCGQGFFNYPFHLAVIYVYPQDHVVTKISPTTKDSS